MFAFMHLLIRAGAESIGGYDAVTKPGTDEGALTVTEKLITEPGADHPITIESHAGRVVVSAHGRVIADTGDAALLREAGYPPVAYIPLSDVDTSLLEATDHTSYCPYKGDCSYYSIVVGDETRENAVWEYRAPYAAVAQIKDRVAFYPNKVEIAVK